MRAISLKNTALAVAGFMAASVSAVPSLTPNFPTSSSDGAVTIESMPQVVSGTGTFTLPSGLSEAPGPVVTGGTGTDSASTSGSVSVTTSSTNSTRTTSGTGTTTAPASTSSTGAGLPGYTSSNILVAGLFMLSAAGAHLL